MAKTITKTIFDKTAQQRICHINITCDSSYATGGYPLSPQECGMVNIDRVIAETETVGTHFPVFDYTNNKVVVFVAAGTQVANAADISTIKLRLTVFGY